MKTKLFTPRFIFVLTLIVVAAAMRLIPHWPNVTPIAAMALFGGVYMSRKVFAFIIPLVAMFLSDLLLGLHISMIAVYAAFAITVGIGIIVSRKPRFINIALATVGSTIIFFLITNFAAWISSPGLYPQTFIGLVEAYAAGLVFLNDGNGISFFLNSLLGDLFYTFIFFGVFYLARLKFPVLATTR